MKTKAKTESYNVGYKDAVQLYDAIAENPDKYIKKAKDLLERDRNGGVMDDPKHEGTMAEHFKAMDFFIEYKYDWICNELFDYRTSKYSSH